MPKHFTERCEPLQVKVALVLLGRMAPETVLFQNGVYLLREFAFKRTKAGFARGRKSKGRQKECSSGERKS
jgi:hypothetical protein